MYRPYLSKPNRAVSCTDKQRPPTRHRERPECQQFWWKKFTSNNLENVSINPLPTPYYKKYATTIPKAQYQTTTLSENPRIKQLISQRITNLKKSIAENTMMGVDYLKPKVKLDAFQMESVLNPVPINYSTDCDLVRVEKKHPKHKGHNETHYQVPHVSTTSRAAINSDVLPPKLLIDQINSLVKRLNQRQENSHRFENRWSKDNKLTAAEQQLIDIFFNGKGKRHKPDAKKSVSVVDDKVKLGPSSKHRNTKNKVNRKRKNSREEGENYRKEIRSEKKAESPSAIKKGVTELTDIPLEKKLSINEAVNSFNESSTSEDVYSDVGSPFAQEANVFFDKRLNERRFLSQSMFGVYDPETDSVNSPLPRRNRQFGTPSTKSGEKSSLLNYFKRRNYMKPDGDALSEASFNECVNRYAKKFKKTSKHQAYRRPSITSKQSVRLGSITSIKSIVSQPSIKRPPLQPPVLEEDQSVLLSVVAPINYRGYVLSKSGLERSTDSIISPKRLRSKQSIQMKLNRRSTTESSKGLPYADLSALKAMNTQNPLTNRDISTERGSMEIDWKKTQWKVLIEKRKAAQAKIAQIIQNVQIRELKKEKPKRNFIEEYSRQVWIPRISHKEPPEKRVPRRKFPTRLEIVPMPSELTPLKPMYIRRYLLNKPQKSVEQNGFHKEDYCRTCFMFGLGHKDPDTPLIREMRTKVERMKLWNYYLSLKRREACPYTNHSVEGGCD